MRKILKVTSILGIATLLRIFAGALRAKFLAWRLGPSGFGVIGQAVMYSVFAAQLCSLNMGMGITKEISESISRKKEEKMPLIVDAAGTFQFIASILFILAVLPFSLGLTKFVFSDVKYWPYFVGITLSTPFAIYLVGMASAIFYGFRKVAEFTKLMVLYTIVALILLILMVYLYKVEGALASIIIVAVISFFMSYYFIKKELGLKPTIRFRLFADRQARQVSLNLFQYGLISFIPGTVNMLALLYLRGFYIKQYGIEANGFYQVVYGISAYYLPFALNGIWGHLYPEMCSIREREDVNKELNQFMRFSLFAMTAIAAAAIITRKFLILVLFSKDFMRSYDLLGIQAVGDISFVLFCMFSTALMARRKFKAVIVISTIGYNLVLGISYFAFARITSIGLASLNMAVLFTNILLVAIHLVYSKLDTGFQLNRENALLLVKCAACMGVLYFIPGDGIMPVALKISAAAAWLLLSVSRHEMRSFADLAFSSLRKKDVN